MSAGAAAKLLTRTCPRTPCAPIMAPISTRSGRAMSLCLSGVTLGSRRRRRRGRARRRGFALLRLFTRRRAFRRLADFRLRAQTRFAEEARDALARQGADAEPMLDPLGPELHPLGIVLLQHRVIGAELLDEAPVARASAVRHHDLIEGPLFGAGPRHANFK